MRRIVLVVVLAIACTACGYSSPCRCLPPGYGDTGRADAGPDAR